VRRLPALAGDQIGGRDDRWHDSADRPRPGRENQHADEVGHHGLMGKSPTTSVRRLNLPMRRSRCSIGKFNPSYARSEIAYGCTKFMSTPCVVPQIPHWTYAHVTQCKFDSLNLSVENPAPHIIRSLCGIVNKLSEVTSC